MSLTFHCDNFQPVPIGWARQTLRWLMADLGLKKDITFVLSGHKEGAGHDGTASEDGNIDVTIDGAHAYPYLWAVNPKCGTGYVNNVTLIENAEELFIYLAAHELRHLWQWENKRATSTLLRLMKMTDETDADLYAIRVLSAFKSQ